MTNQIIIMFKDKQLIRLHKIFLYLFFIGLFLVIGYIVNYVILDSNKLICTQQDLMSNEIVEVPIEYCNGLNINSNDHRYNIVINSTLEYELTKYLT